MENNLKPSLLDEPSPPKRSHLKQREKQEKPETDASESIHIHLSQEPQIYQ